ncbi:MAG: hypothetical protein LC687_03925 [Actinobacteria bacterium]|nr:hypothetical protein [Actinomycetota bacterium]MCA1806988.1 hypothetical protein [Actinomycetota bacterium]
MKIDTNKRFYIRIKGLMNAQWVEVATSKADLGDSLEGKNQEEAETLLEGALDQFNDVINNAYKEGQNGYVQLGNTSINIQSFAAIEVLYVQGTEEIDFTGK